MDPTAAIPGMRTMMARCFGCDYDYNIAYLGGLLLAVPSLQRMSFGANRSRWLPFLELGCILYEQGTILLAQTGHAGCHSWFCGAAFCTLNMIALGANRLGWLPFR